jgi:hypothetical protein
MEELSVRLENSLKQFSFTLEEAINTEPRVLKKIGFGNRSIIELEKIKEKFAQVQNIL